MKVLHVETGLHLYGGAQQVAYLLEGLVQQNVDCALVCPPGAAIGAHFRNSAVRVFEIPCGGDLDFRFIGRLKNLLITEKPDVVHLHSRRGADVLGGVAARRAGVPCVLSRRVDNPESRLLLRWKYAHYDRVICISEGIARVLRGQGVAEGKLRVVRSAVDGRPWQHPASREEFLREFALPETALTIGVAAQLIERKGHSLLLQALQRQQPLISHLRVLFFGQGPLRESLQREARERGLGEIVQFAGFRKDLPRWMGRLDLLVHPAYMEGLGVSLMQASAAGVPILACAAGGIPEVVREGINGRLIAPGDVAALSTALADLLSDAALRQRMSRDGRLLAEQEFSTAAMIAGNLAVYRELAKN